jgi:chemotaxis response regulator CheB
MGDDAPIRVLVVDPEPVVRNGIWFMLSAYPAVTVIAFAGIVEEALRLVGTVCPEVVLLEPRLPRMTGMTVVVPVGALRAA